MDVYLFNDEDLGVLEDAMLEIGSVIHEVKPGHIRERVSLSVSAVNSLLSQLRRRKALVEARERAGA